MRTYEIMKPNSLFFDFEKGLDTFFDSPKSAQRDPVYELNTSDTSYELAFEAPGFLKEDLKIELKDNKLTISGVRASYFDTDKKVNLEETFIIPKDTLQDQISVNFSDGVLRVEIPKDMSSLESKILEIK